MGIGEDKEGRKKPSFRIDKTSRYQKQSFMEAQKKPSAAVCDMQHFDMIALRTNVFLMKTQ